ncbi:MAG: hypothetical protein QM784_01485 [Polyangiaceae bacterium]
MIKKGKLGVIETLEKFLPSNRFQTVFSAEAREVDSQNSRATPTPSTLYGCWMTAMLLDPVANFIMIDGCVRAAFGGLIVGWH